MRWATVALVLLAASLAAGCLADLRRAGLSTSWDADARLAEGPVLTVGDWPSMLVVEGEVGIEAAERVELTAVVGHLTDSNGTLLLRPVLLTLGDETIRPGESRDDPVYMSDGDAVRATFVPGPSASTRVVSGEPLEVSVELRWRYSEDGRFDAGRFTFERNVTAQPATGLGYGAAELHDGLVRALVFEAVDEEPVEGEAEVEVFTVRAGGVDRLTSHTATLAPGQGVVIAELSPNLLVPDGAGYLVFVVRGEGMEGTAVTPLQGEDQRTPAPAAVLVMALLAVAAIMGRRP